MANATQPAPGPKPGVSLLERILHPANLAEAWDETAANGGIPGADRLSISRYRRNWEERLLALAAAVRAGSYRPGPLRVVFIAKRDGGQRRISVPTLDDRVLQRAALQVLLPHFDRQFLSCSYGYRPKRGVAQAVAAVIRYRDRGMRWVLEADIDDCFGSLDHEILLGLLAAEIKDAHVMALMHGWLAAGRPRQDTPCGIALGMPISPLWANIYLHRMDRRLLRRRWPLVRYADDFVIPARTAEFAEQARADVIAALTDLKLTLEPTKTRVTSFDDGFEFLGVRFKGDAYTFIWQHKRISVQGKFNWLWGRHMTYDY